jgi:NADPH-dependent 7-cyano-7-deazaguanine reductase QueF
MNIEDINRYLGSLRTAMTFRNEVFSHIWNQIFTLIENSEELATLNRA